MMGRIDPHPTGAPNGGDLRLDGGAPDAGRHFPRLMSTTAI